MPQCTLRSPLTMCNGRRSNLQHGGEVEHDGHTRAFPFAQSREGRRRGGRAMAEMLRDEPGCSILQEGRDPDGRKGGPSPANSRMVVTRLVVSRLVVSLVGCFGTEGAEEILLVRHFAILIVFFQGSPKSRTPSGWSSRSLARLPKRVGFREHPTSRLVVADGHGDQRSTFSTAVFCYTDSIFRGSTKVQHAFQSG